MLAQRARRSWSCGATVASTVGTAQLHCWLRAYIHTVTLRTPRQAGRVAGPTEARVASEVIRSGVLALGLATLRRLLQLYQ